MLNAIAKLWPSLIVALLTLCMTPSAYAEEKTGDAAQPGLQQRIDFGNAYILGQSIKSGAVYLLHRKQSELEGMIDVRMHYREEIMEDYALEQTAIVSNDEGQQAEASKK